MDSRDNQEFPYRFFPKCYKTGYSAAYRYYRLRVIANHGGKSHGIQFAGVRLMGSPGDPLK